MYQRLLIEHRDDISSLQSAFLRAKSLYARKSLGQFFTGSIVSGYMASLVKKPNSKIVNILDAGAGTGILTASAALHVLGIGCKNVHAVLYELDNEALLNLERTLKIIQNIFS